MRNAVLAVLLACSLLAAPAALADGANYDFGGDAYAAGQAVSIAAPVAHDAFAAGWNVSLTAPVAGDAHLAGFEIQSTSAVTGNVYAAGFNIHLVGGVGGNVTAMGNSVTLQLTSPLAGNARLAGATLLVDNDIAGSLLATAQTLTLNSSVKGDLSFVGETLTFGPNARVDGTLQIRGPNPITVPPSVAPADRVTYIQMATPDYTTEVGRTAGSVVSGFWVGLWAAALWWLLLFVVGAAMISLAPRLVAALDTVSAVRPFRRLGVGLLSFAAVIGLVPLSFMTLIGLPLLPIVGVFVLAACSAAYLGGVYFTGLRISARIRPIETNGARIVVLAISLVVAGLLTMVPFVGWFITLAFLAFGFGLMAAVTMVRWSRPDVDRLAALGGPAPTA